MGGSRGKRVTVTYVTSDRGFECAYELLIKAWDVSRTLVHQWGDTVMVRTVYEDGLTHVIIDGPGRRFGEWTYNNRGREQQLLP